MSLQIGRVYSRLNALDVLTLWSLEINGSRLLAVTGTPSVSSAGLVCPIYFIHNNLNQERKEKNDQEKQILPHSFIYNLASATLISRYVVYSWKESPSTLRMVNRSARITPPLHRMLGF